MLWLVLKMDEWAMAVLVEQVIMAMGCVGLGFVVGRRVKIRFMVCTGGIRRIPANNTPKTRKPQAQQQPQTTRPKPANHTPDGCIARAYAFNPA